MNDTVFPEVGLVLEGGGFRGIYTAAVLDVFHQEQLFFDYIVAVSAGVAYSVSYAARQFERNLKVNPYVADKRYCSMRNLIRKGNYFDWEFIYHHIPTQIIPFDYSRFEQSATRIKAVITNCITGKAEYKEMRADTPENFRDLLAATSALPLISKIQHINNTPYLDGGIADSIPFKKAFDDGKKKLIVVLTRPFGYLKQPVKGKHIIKIAYRKYPKMAQAIIQRSAMYNEQLKELEALEASGKVFVIRPKDAIVVSRLENDPQRLEAAYRTAVEETSAILHDLREWLTK